MPNSENGRKPPRRRVTATVVREELPSDRVKAIKFLGKLLIDDLGGQHGVSEDAVESAFLKIEAEIVAEGLGPVRVYSEVIGILKGRIVELQVGTDGGGG